MVATNAMLVACMCGSGPNTIDKAKLLDLLETKKRSSTDQPLFTRAKWNEIIQAITHSSDWLFIWQEGMAVDKLSPTFARLYNIIGCVERLTLCACFWT